MKTRSAALFILIVAAAQVALAIGISNWVPAVSGGLLMVSGLILWRGAKTPKAVGALDRRVILLAVATFFAVGGLGVAGMWVGGYSLLLVELAMLAAVGSAGWYAIRISRTKATPPNE